MFAADRADNLGVGRDEFVHLVKGHRVYIDAFALLAVGDQLVGAVAALAGAAVEQRVGKTRHMAGGDPGLRVHQNRGVQPDVVGAFLHEFLEPGLLDVVFELNA